MSADLTSDDRTETTKLCALFNPETLVLRGEMLTKEQYYRYAKADEYLTTTKKIRTFQYRHHNQNNARSRESISLLVLRPKMLAMGSLNIKFHHNNVEVDIHKLNDNALEMTRTDSKCDKWSYCIPCNVEGGVVLALTWCNNGRCNYFWCNNGGDPTFPDINRDLMLPIFKGNNTFTQRNDWGKQDVLTRFYLQRQKRTKIIFDRSNDENGTNTKHKKHKKRKKISKKKVRFNLVNGNHQKRSSVSSSTSSSSWTSTKSAASISSTSTA